MIGLDQLAADLAAEQSSLDDIVAPLDEAGLALATPAPGWRIREQVAHLARFDEMARIAITDADVFAEHRRQADVDPDGYGRDLIAELAGSPAGTLLAAWRDERRRLLAAFAAADPAQRIPWYGPSMSVASMATARLMETWAHGQDIVDGLHTDRTPTDRLRHIVHLGVRTRGYSFAVGGRAVPATPVRIELTLPSGTTLEYGPTGRDRVDGTALDFCLVVTRRRHVADTGLVLTGSGAQEWLDVAQTFAGDPGPGRYPGQFPTGLNLGTGANSSPLAARQITSAAAPLDAGRG